MPDKVAISFALSAVTDLGDIQTYYNNERVPDVGNRLMGEIISMRKFGSAEVRKRERS